MDKNKLVAIVSQGRVADIVSQHFSDFVVAQKQEIIAKLVTKYRNGERDAVTLSSGLAEYAALEDLEVSIKRAIRKGNDAANRLTEDRNE